MKILIVDDEPIQLEMLKGFLEKQGYYVSTAKNGSHALERFNQEPFSLVLIDHKMPDMTGDKVIEQIKMINPMTRCIMITAHGSVGTAIKVMKLGTDDLLEKPVDLTHLLNKIRKIEEEIFIEDDIKGIEKRLTEQKGELPVKIIGQSPPIKHVISLAGRAAATEWTSLISGETGTGKELIARLIHLLSPRAAQPFIEVNCAAIPENLFESELFGHEKGAFSGAVSKRRGQFELAQGGSIFLDEIGELPLHLQPKLLRAIQDKKISPIGSEKDIDIDVRIIAASNRSLKQFVEDGGFREDLFFRLNVLDIYMPPLNQRKEDIPELAAYFLKKFSPVPMKFHPDALDILIRYDFPGNVRELEHVIQRAVAYTHGSLIRMNDLPPEVRFHNRPKESGPLEDRLLNVERQMILMALEEHDWVQTKAAVSLGISERVLRYKLKKHQIKKNGYR